MIAPMRAPLPRWVATLAAGTVPLAVLVGTGSGVAHWLDTGEFVGVASDLGISHPPGHPLAGLTLSPRSQGYEVDQRLTFYRQLEEALERDPQIAEVSLASHVPLPADQVLFEPSWSAVAGHLAERARPGDIVMTLGAGDIVLLGSEVLDLLAERQGDNR